MFGGYVNTVIVGAGQAGLAMSASLNERGVDHVVLERGRLAERWRSQRWDSLRVLTPNWMTRLPGAPAVADPDGFMTKDELVSFFERYAASFGCPVVEGVEVRAVRRSSGRFAVETNRGCLEADNVVVATGFAAEPRIPAVADRLDPRIHQIHSAHYKRPEALPPGGVLVVGAGASGIQIASELRRAGRDVWLSTGRHARAVRRYRGRDLWWWLEAMGTLEDTVDEVRDVQASRSTPSLGLSGADGGQDIDLGRLQRSGVRVTGRLMDAAKTKIAFADDLDSNVSAAERRLRRLLDRVDAFAEGRPGSALDAPSRPVPARVQAAASELDLVEAGVRTVVWCTGFRRDYSWLHLPVVDGSGELIQQRGVMPVDGAYVLGMRFMWRRGSHFIDGVGTDAEYVADRIHERTAQRLVAV